MAKFTVRVELRDSEDADYDALHKKMEAEDFSREITISSGNTYDLPSAEYIYESETKTTEDVGRLAKKIASKIKERPRILVTKSDGRWISGLDET